MLKNVGIARYAAGRATAEAVMPTVVEGPTRRDRPRLEGSLLVTAGDHRHLGGPLRLAEALARRDRVHAHVLAVVRPLPSLVSLGASFAADLEPRELDECRRELARARGRRRVRETVGLSSFFSTSAALGSPAPTVAATARERTAAYVLSGLAPADAPTRAAAADTVSRMAAEANVPVLAVQYDQALLPRRALAAVDLGEASVRAAHAALQLLAEGGTLTLAYVVPGSQPLEGHAPGDAEIRTALHALRRIGNELGAAGDLPVHLVVLQGEPATVLSEWFPSFDLVTLGLSRRVEGDLTPEASVSAAAFRHTRGAVLVAPAARRLEEVAR